MEGSLKDLSDYRLERAKEDLDRAKREFAEKQLQNIEYIINLIDDYLKTK